MTPAQLATRLKVSVEGIERAIQAGELLAFDKDGKLAIPDDEAAWVSEADANALLGEPIAAGLARVGLVRSVTILDRPYYSVPQLEAAKQSLPTARTELERATEPGNDHWSRTIEPRLKQHRFISAAKLALGMGVSLPSLKKTAAKAGVSLRMLTMGARTEEAVERRHVPALRAAVKQQR